MTTTAHSKPTNPDRELTITRTFDVPPRAVFHAWTDPTQAKHWMGPRGFTAAHVGGDLRQGGKWRLCLRPDDGGKEVWQGGTYREITPPNRLAFTFAWDDEHGLPSHPTIVTVTLTGMGDRATRMSFHQATFRSTAERDGHRDGWNSTFDRLAEFLNAI
jgi:uncharacterized protein YndB with AHSA1/START domain